MFKFDKVISAKTRYIQLFIWTALLVLLQLIIIKYLLPATFLALFGDGINFDMSSHAFVINTAEFMVPFLIGAIFILYGYLKYVVNKRYSRAKSFLILGILFVILFPFRSPIYHLLLKIYHAV